MRARDAMGSAALIAAIPMVLDFLRPKASASREERIYQVIGQLLRNNEWKATTDDGDAEALVDYSTHVVLAVEKKLAELEKRDDDESLERIRAAHKQAEAEDGSLFSATREEWKKKTGRCEVTGCDEFRALGSNLCPEHDAEATGKKH